MMLMVYQDAPFQLIQTRSSYEEHIKPMLKERCFACHGSLKQGGLRLDTAMHIRERGAREPLIDLKHPDQSILLQQPDLDMEERMPPEGKAVDPAILEHVEAWIMGALTFARRRGRRSIRPLVLPPPVEATITTRGTHPIDAFQPIHRSMRWSLGPFPAAHVSALPESGECPSLSQRRLRVNQGTHRPTL